MRIKAYLFSTGACYGFSVLSNGSNLPRLHDGTPWEPLQVKLTDFAELASYTSDVTTARFNLLTRGYHFCKAPSAEITDSVVAA
jgi:hypothetical protein